ncbi:EamA family transporter [Flavobacteriaceae bacterium XHP0103]|uniref:EamA family transporter n=1 Tax=Marixanthotalea marina TaxID=2844359 RepID=UPI002989F43C|nr:EamA family transporter [Marixanthotalea marina]MBU3822207.1 EamA family transporter [Marixanthotalea marina]
MANQKKTVLILLAFFAIYVIWGSTYLLNKIAVSELPPFKLASIRFIVAAILIFLIAKLLKVDISITRQQLKNTIIAGFLFLTLGNGVVVWALKFVDSGFAALEISAQPLVVLLLMWLIQGKKISAMSYIGVILGFIGVFLLVSQKQIISEDNQLVGMVMIFGCMLSWAYGSLFVGKSDLPSNYFVNTGYQMLSGGIMLAVLSFCFGESWTSPASWSTDVLWAMVLLIVFGSVIAFTAFNFLLKEVSPEKVATNTYVNPIIALFLGWWILNETITLQSIIAAIVLLSGVYFINTKRMIKPRGIGR